MDTHSGYKKADLQAAQQMLHTHIAKLYQAIEDNQYPNACSAIRAIEDECKNASRIAMVLSYNSRNNYQPPRIPRGGITEGLNRG